MNAPLFRNWASIVLDERGAGVQACKLERLVCGFACSESLMTGMRMREIKEMLVQTGIEGGDVWRQGAEGNPRI